VPYATNALDGSRVYVEDDGSDGETVVLHGGLLDSVDLVRDSNIAGALPLEHPIHRSAWNRNSRNSVKLDFR
jgi:hypothetical protein